MLLKNIKYNIFLIKKINIICYDIKIQILIIIILMKTQTIVLFLSSCCYKEILHNKIITEIK